MPIKRIVWLGWDPREETAYTVAQSSLLRTTSLPLDIQPIKLSVLQSRGWYVRPTERRTGLLWDVLSDAPMSTEHAIARFFVPMLCDYTGWAVSADCDILCRHDLADLFALADERFAVMVVQHQHMPTDVMKMDGQIQTAYSRKNWSSVILWNTAHPAHRVLTLDVLNTWPGRDLHAFRWLEDFQIGSLPLPFNWLAGVSRPDVDPAIVHFTLGTPDMPGYEHQPYADEWRSYLPKVVSA